MSMRNDQARARNERDAARIRRPPEPQILLFQGLHPTRLIGLQTAIFLAPAVIEPAPANAGVCALTAIRRLASLAVLPSASTISASPNVPIISSGVGRFLPIHVLPRGPDYDNRWTTRKGADQSGQPLTDVNGQRLRITTPEPPLGRSPRPIGNYSRQASRSHRPPRRSRRARGLAWPPSSATTVRRWRCRRP